MTRIYFKPQTCSVRGPKITRKNLSSKKHSAAASDRSSPLSASTSVSASVTSLPAGNEDPRNWRNQLDPDAIEQIADGLEKMVLSWSQQPIDTDPPEQHEITVDKIPIPISITVPNPNPNLSHSQSNTPIHSQNHSPAPSPKHSSSPDMNIPFQNSNASMNLTPIHSPTPDQSPSPDPSSDIHIHNRSPSPSPNQTTDRIIQRHSPTPNPSQTTDRIIQRLTPSPNPNQSTDRLIQRQSPSPNAFHSTDRLIQRQSPSPNAFHSTDRLIQRHHPSPDHNPSIDSLLQRHTPSPSTDRRIQSHSPSPNPSPSLISPLTTDRSFPLSPSETRPIFEEIMRGELIKARRPTLTNGADGQVPIADQQSAEASFWYLSPANSLPNCVGTATSDMQDALISSLKLTSNGFSDQSVHHPHHDPASSGDGQSRKGPRIRNIDEDGDEEEDEEEEEVISNCGGNVEDSPKEVAEDLEPEVSSYSAQANNALRVNQAMEINPPPPNNHSPCSQLSEASDESTDYYKKKVEELQIALLECAMEYEVKIVEMKMEMLQMKSEQRQKDGDSSLHSSRTPSEKSMGISSQDIDQLFSPSSHRERTERQKVEFLRKQLCKLQREKRTITRELCDLKKRERQFDLQRRGLDDALGRVNTLQRELGKREQEIMDCQLREKEVRAQLYDLQVALHNIQNSKVDSRKLVALLPALREWLQAVKRIPYDQASHASHDPYDRSPRYPPTDSIVMSVTKEIQGLQKSLTKLASKHSREAIFDLKKVEIVKTERTPMY